MDQLLNSIEQELPPIQSIHMGFKLTGVLSVIKNDEKFFRKARKKINKDENKKLDVPVTMNFLLADKEEGDRFPTPKVETAMFIEDPDIVKAFLTPGVEKLMTKTQILERLGLVTEDESDSGNLFSYRTADPIHKERRDEIIDLFKQDSINAFASEIIDISDQTLDEAYEVKMDSFQNGLTHFGRVAMRFIFGNIPIDDATIKMFVNNIEGLIKSSLGAILDKNSLRDNEKFKARKQEVYDKIKELRGEFEKYYTSESARTSEAQWLSENTVMGHLLLNLKMKMTELQEQGQELTTEQIDKFIDDRLYKHIILMIAASYKNTSAFMSFSDFRMTHDPVRQEEIFIHTTQKFEELGIAGVGISYEQSLKNLKEYLVENGYNIFTELVKFEKETIQMFPTTFTVKRSPMHDIVVKVPNKGVQVEVKAGTYVVLEVGDEVSSFSRGPRGCPGMPLAMEAAIDFNLVQILKGQRVTGDRNSRLEIIKPGSERIAKHTVKRRHTPDLTPEEIVRVNSLEG